MPLKKLNREQALLQITQIVQNKPCTYELVPFQRYNQVHKLRSDKYKPFLVLCKAHTLSSAGFLVCKLAMTGACKIQNAVMVFNVSNGGTGRLDRHMRLHKTPSTGAFSLSLSQGVRKEMNKAAAVAVALDLRPVSFTDGKQGMQVLANAIFKAGQSVPVNDDISPSSILSKESTLRAEIHTMAKELRDKFKETVLGGLLKGGGGLSTDGVTLKIQDRQFYDLTVHYIDICPTLGFKESPKIEMVCNTLLLREKTGTGDAECLRSLLDAGRKSHFGKGIDDFTENFTMVTDRASVMARLAGSSVSPRVCDCNLRWLGCAAHMLNTAMKGCVASLQNSQAPELRRIWEDLYRVKNVVRIFKQGGLNERPANGYRLIQEAETRFATTYNVIQRFLNSIHLVEGIVEEKEHDVAKPFLSGILSESDGEGEFMGYPALEAFLDAFAFVVDAQTRLQASKFPTIHMALPLLQRCFNELKRIINGGSIKRGGRRGIVPPSSYSKALCATTVEWLNAKVRVHDLWVVGCYLNPITREFQFIPDPQKREHYCERASRVCRELMSKGQSSAVVANVRQNSGDGWRERNVEALSGPGNGSNSCSEFDLAAFADTHFSTLPSSDEITKYNATDIGGLGLNINAFSKDPFSSIRYWDRHSGSYPGLFRIARRVFATPVTSSLSERVFSAVNRIVTRDRASLSPQMLEDLIVIRSLN